MFSLVILMALGSVIKPLPGDLIRRTRESGPSACGFLCRLESRAIPSQIDGTVQSPKFSPSHSKDTDIVKRSLPLDAEPEGRDDNKKEETASHDAVKEAQKGMVFQHPSDGMWRLAGRGRKLKPNQDQMP